MGFSRATIILRDEAPMPCWRWIAGPNRKDPIRRGNVSQWQVSRGRLTPMLGGIGRENKGHVLLERPPRTQRQHSRVGSLKQILCCVYIAIRTFFPLVLVYVRTQREKEVPPVRLHYDTHHSLTLLCGWYKAAGFSFL